MSISNPSIGIVGLPNVGKSTLFNVLLKKQVAVAQNYPFTTIEPNVGIVEVVDERLDKLAEIVKKSEGLAPSFNNIPAVVKFVDIAGLVRGAHKGEGLGNQFLSHIREVDVIVFVVRDFKNKDIIQTGSTEPQEDLEVLKSELLLKDLETIEKRLESMTRELKTISAADPKVKALEILKSAKKIVEQGKWLEEIMEKDDLAKIRDVQLLCAKKYIVVVNTDEGQLTKQGSSLYICAKMEEELAELSEEEQREYFESLGVSKSGLERLVKKAYETLGLITFFTAGPKEVRAWTISRGSLAPKAAAVIHTDFERGFIAADVVAFDKFIGDVGWQQARLRGHVKTIGKEEEIADGEVVEFKFNV